MTGITRGDGGGVCVAAAVAAAVPLAATCKVSLVVTCGGDQLPRVLIWFSPSHSPFVHHPFPLLCRVHVASFAFSYVKLMVRSDPFPFPGGPSSRTLFPAFLHLYIIRRVQRSPS